MAARIRRGVLFLSMVLLALSSSAQIAPNFFTTSPPNPVGSGARAMGVGGAFIAVGDDATAASWNPACLIQLEKPEATFVLSEDFRTIGGNNVDLSGVNYLAESYPFTIGQVNMIVSLNYQRLYDFYFKYESDQVPDSQSGYSNMAAQFLGFGTGDPADLIGQYNVISLSRAYNQTQQDLIKSSQLGELGAISPAFALQIVPQFSLGFTYNFWKDGWGGRNLQQKYDQNASGLHQDEFGLAWDMNGDCTCNGGQPCTGSGSTVEYVDNPACIEEYVPQSVVDDAYGGPGMGPSNPELSNMADYTTRTIIDQQTSLSGQNFNAGFLWDITGRWSVGGVYRSPLKLNADRRVKWSYSQSSSVPAYNTPENTGTENYEDRVYFPPSYGLGAGFRYSDALTFTADVTRTDWNQYLYKPEHGDKFSLVNGLEKSKAGVDPTYTARLGTEYLLIRPNYVVPFRAGFFYDPEPAKNHPESVFGATIGSGFAYKWLIMDLTYYYRWGNNITLAATSDTDHQELLEVKKGDLSQHQIMLSTIIHFE